MRERRGAFAAAAALAALLSACGPGATNQPARQVAAASGVAAPGGGAPQASPVAPLAGAPGGPATGASGRAHAAAAGASPAAHATSVPFATPMSLGGHATVHTGTAGDFTQTGSTCAAGPTQVVFAFGWPGSGEEVDVAIHSGYTGPGTYSAPSADAYVSASHDGHTWYAQLSSSSGASITVDPGGRSGSFRFTDQVGSREGVTGVFACG